MILKFMSITVEDQEKAIQIYTSILGFKKMADIPMGEYRWLTVVSPDGIEGVELVLEPVHGFGPGLTYQKAMFEAGIPATAFITKNINEEVALLKSRGVKFHTEPTAMGIITTAVFEDGCGNLINLVQPGA